MDLWDRATVLRMAAEAECDVRTLRRFLDGHEIRPMVKTRIERAAKKLGAKLPKMK